MNSEHDTLENNDFCDNLIMLSSMLEQNTSLIESLNELAKLVAKTLHTSNCSIMLLKDNSDEELPLLRVQAHYGDLPSEAYEHDLALGESIAGKVALTGDPILIEDIDSSTYTKTKLIPGGFISFPIILDERIVGVVNVNTPIDKHVFSHKDLELASILSLFISKSIQKINLENVLKSKFALAALAKQGGENKTQIAQDPHRLSKILAKSFFNDMRSIGFENDHIIETATEIISLLGQRIKQS